ncbi:MAG: hypothetical protein RBT78_06825, partial [Kiritimatiellia bacterium]|nr:hypothetical protein [Kiritimatiellia bacterium]
MRRYERVVCGVMVALACGADAADGIWGRTDNTDLVNPAAWTNADNWADGVIAGGGGHAYFTNAFPTLAYRAVEMPPEGVTLNRFVFNNYDSSTTRWNGAYFFVSGGPMRMEEVGGTLPRLDSMSDQLHLFCDVQGTNGLLSSPNYSINLFADTSYTGPTTLESGYWITRFDGVADSADPVLRDYASTNDFLLTGGRLSFYGRPSKTATVTSNWTLVEGKTLIAHASGSNAGAVTPGSPVAGPGLPEGTFVRRIINPTNIVLSAPATSGGTPATLVFSPVASECYQTIRSVENRTDSCEFILNKNNADVLRVEIGELTGAGNILQRVSPGHPSGVLSIRNARAYGGQYTLQDAWLELPMQGEAHPVLSNVLVTAASTLEVPDADAVASVFSLSGTATLTKTGAGRLSANVGFDSTLSVAVEQGSLALPRPAAAGLLAQAALHLDASRADTLELDAEGRVSRWADANGLAKAATNAVSATQPVRTENALNGLPVVDFGAYYGTSGAGSGLFLETREAAVRSAFIVYSGRHHEAVMFGEASRTYACAYTRSANTGSNIWSMNTSTLIKNGATTLDGVKVDGATTFLPDNAFHLVSVVTTGNTGVGSLGNDRDYRSGGQQIAEVILFNRALSQAEQSTVDAYLMGKWFGVTQPRRMADLTLAHGTRLVLPDSETMVVSNLTLRGEVWIEGPGKVSVTGAITQTGTVHVVNGGGFSVANLGGSLEPKQPLAAADPAFWVDACALTNAGAEGVVLENGTNFIVRWNDVRGAGYNFATNITHRPRLRANDINGLPSVSFTRHNNVVPSLSEALFWDQPMNDIRAIFMVVGSQEGGGILLGSSAAANTQDFYRDAWLTPSAPLLKSNSSAALQNGLFYLNGRRIYPLTEGYNGFFQLVEAYPTGPVRASAFAADRNIVNGNGCQRICEVILYNRELSEQEKLNTAEYLMRKWLDRGVPREAALSGFETVESAGDSEVSVAAETDYLGINRYTGGGDLVKSGGGTLVLNSLDIAGRELDVREGTLVLKAGDPAERVPADAYLHVDASAAHTFSNVVVNGTNFVESWRHADGGAVYANMRNTATRVR